MDAAMDRLFETIVTEFNATPGLYIGRSSFGLGYRLGLIDAYCVLTGSSRVETIRAVLKRTSPDGADGSVRTGQ